MLIDESGSITGYSKDLIKCIEIIIDTFRTNDNAYISIFPFDNKTRTLAENEKSKDFKLNFKLRGGGTNFKEAFARLNRSFETKRELSQDFIYIPIFLTDGEDDTTTSCEIMRKMCEMTTDIITMHRWMQ